MKMKVLLNILFIIIINISLCEIDSNQFIYNYKNINGVIKKLKRKEKITILHIGDSHVAGKILPYSIKKGIDSITKRNNDYISYAINGASVRTINSKINIIKSLIKNKNPDLIIISLGTNDSFNHYYNSKFNKEKFRFLIREVKKYSSNILLTGPPDYYKSGKPNKNVPLCNNIIKEISDEEECSYWNLYKKMGGYNSLAIWYKKGLVKKDKIHFTKNGYEKISKLLIKDLIFYI